MKRKEVGITIGRCAQLATLLEVSAYPKPGNIHRLHDFPTTRYEHFLAGSVALSPALNSLAEKGYDVKKGSKKWQNIGLGKGILLAVEDSLRWQRGGNVNLGIVLLFAPISAAAGYTLKNGSTDVTELRKKIIDVTQCTTSGDSVAVYRAIQKTMTERVLGHVDELDVNDKSSIYQIKVEGLSLIKIFQSCAERDSICREWISGFEVTFTKGYPYLAQSIQNKDPNTAVVDTFLYLLSEEPDSLISRKRGHEAALYVSKKARKILTEGGFESKKGRELSEELDRELQIAGGALNPGTTADITAASIFILLLTGWRP